MLAAVLLATGVVEVFAFLAVAEAIGPGWAVLAVAAGCLIGLLLLRREGMRAWRRFRDAEDRGEPPGRRVSDRLVGLLGALLLAVPGFVTGVVGLLLLIPPVRMLARWSVESFATRRVSSAVAGDLFGPRRVRVRRGAPVRAEPGAPERSTGPTIEGEIVDVPPERRIS